MSNPVLKGLKYTDRDLIESILNSYFIVDYGFISTVNADGTIDVTHARKGVTRDGEELPEYLTKKIEILTLSWGGLSIELKPEKGDGVLLVGLKDYVKTVKGINQAEAPKAFIHYTRDTMKAIPLALFNEEAKIRFKTKDGNAKFETDGKFEVDASDAISMETKADASIKATAVTVDAKAAATIQGTTVLIDSKTATTVSGTALILNAKGTLSLSTSGGTLGVLFSELIQALEALQTEGGPTQQAISSSTVTQLEKWKAKFMAAFP